MENKELILKAFALALSIEAKGIGSAHAYYLGGNSGFDVSVYYPKWSSHKRPIARISIGACYQKEIDNMAEFARLEQIEANGFTPEQIEEFEGSSIKAEREQYLALKAKFEPDYVSDPGLDTKAEREYAEVNPLSA